jgi:uncharacterized protein YukE
MEEVKIRSLKLRNFKGTRNLTVPFNPDGQTSISGDNETGKTTIFDAFTWLLFGKDSLGKTAFEIKTLTPDNQPIPQLDHEVEGKLLVDGRLIKLRKVYREIWGKTRGEAEVKLMRDETVCYWDGLEILVGEYNRRISDIISEDLFRLITDTAYFNRLGMSGKREVLICMAGTIDMDSILETRPDLAEIINLVNGNDITDEKAKAAAEKKRLQDECKLIPSRIDTAYTLMPEKKDWDSIKDRILEGENNIKAIDAKIQDVTSAGTELNEKAGKILNEIGSLQREFSTKQNQFRLEVEQYNNGLELEVGNLQNLISRKFNLIENTKHEIESKQEIIDNLNKRNAELREDWNRINETTIQIDPNQLCCPTCGREYEADQMTGIEAELTEKFNKRKISDLNGISTQGTGNKNRIDKLIAEIEGLNQLIEKITIDHDKLVTELIANQKTPRKNFEEMTIPELFDIENGIFILKQELEDLKASQSQPDTSEMKNEKQLIQLEINALNRELGAIAQIELTEKEIANLTERQRELSQRIAEIEQFEFQIAELGKTKLQETERLVNEKFNYVQFRLFKFLKNGGEEPVCDAMVNGVPFDSLNSAARINCGMDIINALCEYHQVHAPVFIDNRETINDLLPSESQIINLVVTKDKQLIIN